MCGFLSIRGEWLTGPRWTGCKQKSPLWGAQEAVVFALRLLRRVREGLSLGRGRGPEGMLEPGEEESSVI